MASSPLVRVFLAASGSKSETNESIEGALADALFRARAVHPELAVDDEDLARSMGASVAESADLRAALEALRVADLRLAVGCTLGLPAAVALLEREYLGPARASVVRILGPADADDGVQALREKLLVGQNGSPPRIAEYSGRGSLAGWIKVVAARVALGVLRARRPMNELAEDEEMLELPAPLRSEIEPMRPQYRAAFKEAFHATLAKLEPRDRTLLRLQFVDGLTVDEIGGLYRVHRATAARWAARARELLLEGTRRELARALHVPEDALDSILDVVRSHVDLSLRRVLDDGEARAG